MQDTLKTYFNWSTGKDSALALYYLLQDESYNISCLFTSVNSHYNRVSMHGLRAALLQQQIAAIGIPSMIVELPEQPTNAEYEALLKNKVDTLLAEGYECAAFGDIFLEDLKAYRQKQLAPYGIQTVFPLWKKDTKELLTQFIELGFKAISICIDGTKLDKSFVGRIIDYNFINDLPADVDICGENGEFHTFCFDGPYFKHPVHFTKGEIVMREYNNNGFKSQFWFCDLIPK